MPALEQYISIDIETLGLDPSYCDIIEIGAVIDDLKSPLNQLKRFHCYVLPPKRRVKGVKGKVEFYRGSPFAMAMHKEKLERIANQTEGFQYLPRFEVAMKFRLWLLDVQFPGSFGDKITVAGKNFDRLDGRFLSRIPGFDGHNPTYHRVIDPSMLYMDPKKDALPPGLEKCLHLAGFDKSVDHSAIGDALDVIRCLRFKWGIPTNED